MRRTGRRLSELQSESREEELGRPEEIRTPEEGQPGGGARKTGGDPGASVLPGVIAWPGTSPGRKLRSDRASPGRVLEAIVREALREPRERPDDPPGLPHAEAGVLADGQGGSVRELHLVGTGRPSKGSQRRSTRRRSLARVMMEDRVTHEAGEGPGLVFRKPGSEEEGAGGAALPGWEMAGRLGLSREPKGRPGDLAREPEDVPEPVRSGGSFGSRRGGRATSPGSRRMSRSRCRRAREAGVRSEPVKTRAGVPRNHGTGEDGRAVLHGSRAVLAGWFFDRGRASVKVL